MREGSQCDREREERMRRAAVAPVEDPVPAAPDEDVAVVEVVVLDRFGQPEGGQLVAEAGGVVDADVVGKLGDPREPLVRKACLHELVDVRRGG
jgi:hypothetical protein